MVWEYQRSGRANCGILRLPCKQVAGHRAVGAVRVQRLHLQEAISIAQRSAVKHCCVSIVSFGNAQGS